MSDSSSIRLVTLTEQGRWYTATAISILTGVPVMAVHAWLARSGLAHPQWGLPSTCMPQTPADWQRSARRRTSEARAHSNTEDAAEVFQYWAARENPGKELQQNIFSVDLVPKRGIDG